MRRLWTPLDVPQLFDGIDTSGNGEINLMELRRGSAWLEQYDHTPSALKELLNTAAQNGNRLQAKVYRDPRPHWPS
eukprot:COSAG01_NODE_7286_length_3269_cov_0.980126_4_plen_76_part_00